MQSQDKGKSHTYRSPVRPILKLKTLANTALGISVESDLSFYRDIVGAIKTCDLDHIPDSGLRKLSASLASKVGSGVPLESILVEAFALVQQASRRAIGLDPFDVQMIAGLAMAQGKIAELPTGEGKTLAAVFPAYLYALTRRGVHILTFNDYLARRDAAWMGPIYGLLGLSVGCVQEGLRAEEKKRAYARDITYATAKEAGFDFLRDEICYQEDDLVHRAFHLALVDEADSILIDEARIPLVISGVEDRAAWDAGRLATAVKTMTAGSDYETDDEHRNVFLTDSGIGRAEALLGCGCLYDPKNQQLDRKSVV
jgi:preprotein translocase subunit SecA